MSDQWTVNGHDREALVTAIDTLRSYQSMFRELGSILRSPRYGSRQFRAETVLHLIKNMQRTGVL